MTNDVEHDPDVQQLPFLALDKSSLDSLWSTRYKEIKQFDAVAKLVVKFQHLSYVRFPFFWLPRSLLTLKADDTLDLACCSISFSRSAGSTSVSSPTSTSPSTPSETLPGSESSPPSLPSSVSRPYYVTFLRFQRSQLTRLSLPFFLRLVRRHRPCRSPQLEASCAFPCRLLHDRFSSSSHGEFASTPSSYFLRLDQQLILHPSPLQIVQSHYSRSMEDKGVLESHMNHNLRTTME
jgi:hypothetical protein